MTIPKFVECNSEHVFHKLPPSGGLLRIVDQSTALYHVDTKELTSSGAIADIFQRYREILPEYPTHTLRGVLSEWSERKRVKAVVES